MAKAKSEGLNIDQEKFLIEYLKTLNPNSGRSNAGLAYYKVYGGDRENARQRASILLQNPKMQARIAEFVNDLKTKFEFTKEQVLNEFKGVATFDLRDIYDEETNSLLNIADFPAQAAGAVAGVEVDEIFEMIDGEKVHIGNTVKVKLHSKIAALKGIIDIQGYEAPKKTANTDAAGKDKVTPMTPEQVSAIIAALRAKRK